MASRAFESSPEEEQQQQQEGQRQGQELKQKMTSLSPPKEAFKNVTMHQYLEDFINLQDKGRYFYVGEIRVPLPKALNRFKASSSCLPSEEMHKIIAFEWDYFFGIREGGLLAGKKLSVLIARFMLCLSGTDEETLEKLVGHVEKRSENGQSTVATNFQDVIDATKAMICLWKPKKKEVKVEKREEKIMKENENVMDQLCRAMFDLEWILCGETICVEQWDMVEESGKKIEVTLGVLLLNMLGIRVWLQNNNQNHHDHESWKLLKNRIALLWKI